MQDGHIPPSPRHKVFSFVARNADLEGLGSGQTHQTVNLTPSASQVRILSPPPFAAFGLYYALKVRRGILLAAVLVRGLCGCSSMVEQKPSKLTTRVRFPSPAPFTPAAGGIISKRSGVPSLKV